MPQPAPATPASIAGNALDLALDATYWNPLLENLADSLRGEHTILMLRDDRPENGGLTASARLASDHFQAFLDPSRAQEMASISSRLETDRAVNWSQLISENEFERTPFYNEVVRPANGFHAAVIRHRRPGWSSFLAVCRPRGRGAFDSASIARMQAMSGAITMSLDLYWRFSAARTKSAMLERILDQLEDGVLLTDANGTPLHANTSALRILAQRDGLALGRSGLVATAAPSAQALSDAIAAASRPDTHAEQRLRISRPSRLPMLLTLYPIQHAGMEIAGVGKPAIAIFIHNPEAPRVIDQKAVAGAFSLTARESEIACHVGSGCSIDAIATMLGLQRSTVRSHLIQIFGKTQTHSQAQLAALMNSFIRP
ncbi:helix-turn-helix transcriptional regulator [Achromobacter aloeverae]